MSESASKTTRRDLRRVLGHEAEAAMRRQAEAVGFLSETLRQNQHTLALHHLDLAQLTETVAKCADAVHALNVEQSLFASFLSRGFFARVKWLVKGV